MFSLTIVFGPGPMVWTLLFKDEESANKAHALTDDACDNGMISIIDNFGQDASIVKSQIHGLMLENLEQSKLAHIERALHQARVKVKADEMAMADPVIKSGAMRSQSPILQPAMPGMPQPNGRWS